MGKETEINPPTGNETRAYSAKIEIMMKKNMGSRIVEIMGIVGSNKTNRMTADKVTNEMNIFSLLFNLHSP